MTPDPAAGPASRARPAGGKKPALVYPTGFAPSPFAETGAPGAPLKSPPREQWTCHSPAG
jgi:hypothetical protein